MGDCVLTPIVTGMKDAVPKPLSINPELISNGLNDSLADYEGMTTKWTKETIDEEQTE